MDVYEEFAEVSVCRICNLSEGLERDQLHDKDEVQAHYFCLLFSSGLGQKGKDEDGIRGFLPSDIRKEIKRGARLKCVYCHKKGATVGCAEQRCKKSYHLPCGYKHDSLQQYFNQFKSYCKEHRPSQKPGRRGGKRSDKSDNICTICQEKVVRKATYKVIWSPCCSEYFHRECVQNLAHNHGAYHFRCPHCQNQEDFTKEMQIMGIYIPVQDASWENSNQFQDLDQAPPRLCHAKICFCPHEEGRAYNKEHGLWEVLPCRSCGSRGIHAKCGGLEDYPEPVWDCYNCRSVMVDRQPELLPHTGKLWSHLESNLVSEDLDPALVSKLDSLRTRAEKQNGSTTASSRSGGRSPDSKENTTSSPNKLFEALLATLPHLTDLEDSMPEQTNASDKNNLQLTITPVYSKPSVNAPATESSLSQPVAVSQAAAFNGKKLLMQTPDLHAPHNGNASMAASSFVNGKGPNHRGSNGKVNGTSHAPMDVLMAPSNGLAFLPTAGLEKSCNKAPLRASSENLAGQNVPINLSNDKKKNGVNGTGPKVSLMDVDKRPLDPATGKGKNGVSKDLYLPKNGIRKEIYDYTLEDIIRSRLSDNGDISSSLVDTTSGKTNGYATKMLKDGIQVNGIAKKTPVFRIVNGDSGAVLAGSQRKIPDFFPNRK